MKRNLDSRSAKRIACLAIGCFALAPLLASAGTVPFPASAPQPHDCSHGVTLQLSSSVSAQGDLVLVKVHSSKAMARLTAEWAGQKLLFWRDSLDECMYQALVGIDLEEPAGTYSLALTAQGENEKAACSVPLTVRAGRFATERLHVAKQFVEPNPSDLERAGRERQRLRELYATVTPERLWQGGFRLPLAGVHKGGNFGRRRIVNGEPGSPHSGVDFSAAAGVPVHAAERGRVVLAENLFFSGNTVLLDHGLGVYSLYGHFESTAVAEGDVVEAGAVLGHAGATGRVTGPHLHWGLIVNGAKVNPLEIIRVLGPSREMATNGRTRKIAGGSKNKETRHTR